MRVKLLGKWWKLLFIPMYFRGECDPPNTKGKEIRIRKTLRGEERLEVLIHESLHAVNWSLDEEHVNEISQDIARLLWRLNYRSLDEIMGQS